MQNIIIEKPYEFIAPHRGRFWPTLFRMLGLHRSYLRREEGVVSHEIRGIENLRRSIQAGHGIMLAPNHARTADPLVMGWVAADARCNMYAMASWHLFHQHWFTAWVIHKMGAFSIYREGVDRPAINAAIEILATAERPLILFPEGAVSRTNDRLMALLDGVAFIARTAAKRRSRLDPPGRVVIHPVAIKYFFRGNIAQVVDDVLSSIEHRLTWQPQRHLKPLDRIAKVGKALLALKEMEFLGESQAGTLAERLHRFVDALLQPLEEKWLGQSKTGAVVPRVKAVRTQILPDMVQARVAADEREQRWRDLAALYLAQQVSCYPPDYLITRPSVDRILETIERFEEDLTDKARIHGDLHAVIWIDKPMEISPERDRSQSQDPIMTGLERRLQEMLDQLALESPVYN
jgi:1-acyl-sn-glycerol-3-phosphate acyltransferase